MSVREELRVSDDDYDWLFEFGLGRCWICRQKETGRRLAIDHDHVTGAVRGLLCTSCNVRLGSTRNAEWLRRAADYLEVGERAFSDACKRCCRSAPKQFVQSNGQTTIYRFACCGVEWRIGFRTKGIPYAWFMGASPFPTVHEPIRAK
jgi:hypothetical protein